jgi:antitoxin (DNA-binding transcriptional repressor) of toxin-antitoxin stability system
MIGIMATIHISEAEASNNFAGLMARVREGAEVVIEDGDLRVAVIHPPEPPRRIISECIALAKKRGEETGEAPVLDVEFADALEEIINNRRPSVAPAWE